MKYPRIPLLIVVFVALVSFVVHLRHHVSIFGGGDEGSYIAAGKLMSQSFRFVYPDHALEIGKKYLPLSNFVPPGFRVHNDGASPVEVVSGWNKGFSIFSIPMWLLVPDQGWKFVSPFACAVSIVMIYLLGAAIRSPATGVSAALLMGTNWLQLWFSRYPMTEVLSQALILSMLLCVVSFAHASRKRVLVIFALLAAFSSIVHFANVPMWGMLGAAICVPLLPFSKREVSDAKDVRWMVPFTTFFIDKTKIPAFLASGALTLGFPLAVTLSYWFVDPGVQRYVRFPEKMAATSSRADQLLEALMVRFQNLSLFVPTIFWVGLVICGALFLVNKGIARRWWLLLGAVAITSFLLIVSSGVGTPRVLYVARRNVPAILPALCLMIAVVIDYGTSLLPRRWLSRLVATCVVLGISAAQLKDFYPYRTLDQGKGALVLAADVQTALAARDAGKPQFLILTDHSANMATGLRYVSGIPIINFSPDVTPAVISRMLSDGIDVYFLDDYNRPVAQMVKAMPNARISHLSTHAVWWGHANQLGPTDYPKVSDNANLRFYLYKIDAL